MVSGDSSQTPRAPNARIVPSVGNASDFAVSGESCSQGECKILVTFTASDFGWRTAKLTTAYGDVSLAGNGINGPSLRISPFAPLSVPVFSLQSEDVTITNNGNVPLLGLNSYINAGPNFFSSIHCPSSLPAGQTCTDTVTFVPSAIGNLADGLTVRSTGTFKTLYLSGIGLPVAPRLNPSSLTFGPTQVGVASTTQTVSIQAPGRDLINLTAASTEDASAEFTPSPSQCAGYCSVNITFTPSTTGLRKGGIKVTDALTGLSSTIEVQGTGADPNIAFSPSSLAFSASVGTASAIQAVTVANNGTVPIGIPTVSIAGANPEQFGIQANTCPTTASLLPGGTCTVSVIFQPLAQGAFSGTLQLATTDLNNPTFALNMSGTGLAPVVPAAMVLSPALLSFPDVYVGGSSSSQGVTITNNSQYAMNIQFMKSGNDEDFVLGATDFCSGFSSLQPGHSCRISVQFTPTAAGERTAVVKMVDTYYGFASSVTVSGNALPLSGGPLVFSPSSVTLSGGGIPQEVTVINGGTSDLTIEKMTGIDSSDCGTVIPVNGTCHISVKAGSQQGSVQNLTASILASSSATPYTLPITVAASSDGTVLNTGPLTFGTVPLGSSQQTIITLYGFRFLPPLSTQVTGPNAADFISPGAYCVGDYIVSCDATVTFAPQGSGLRTATIVTRWGNIAAYGVGGAGDGADFTLTPNDVPAAVVLGYVGTVKITNTGAAPLILESSLGLGFSAIDDECNGKLLEIGSSCTVEMSFDGNISGPVGVRFTDSISGTSRSLELNSADGGPPVNYPAATPNSLAFGNVAVGDTSQVQYVTVTQADGHPAATRLDAPKDFLIDDSACAQATPCQIGIRFHPLSATYQETYMRLRDRISGASIGVDLSGTGGFPQISVSPSSVVFPSQEIGSTWAYQPLAIENVGDAALTMGQITLSGTNASDFAIWANTCTYRINPASSCQILLSFVPRALGERTATLQITSDSKTDNVITIPVSATSTPVP